MINLPVQQAGPALSAVINNAAAQSMTLVQRNSFVGDVLSSHFGERFGLTNGEDALKPLLEEGNKRGGDLTRETPDYMEQSSSQTNFKNTPFLKGGCP